MGQKDGRKALRVARLPLLYPFFHALGKGKFGLFFLESRLIGIGQGIDEHLFPPLVFKYRPAGAGRYGTDGTGGGQRQRLSRVADDIDARLLGEGRRGGEAHAVVVIAADEQHGPSRPAIFRIPEKNSSSASALGR